MITKTIEPMKTKSGKEIRFELDTDPENNLDSYFDLHKITAFIGKTEVGYIKASWFKQEEFEPGGSLETVLKFASNYKNNLRIRKYLDTGSLRESMSGLSASYLSWDVHCEVDWENESEDVLKDYFEKVKSRIDREYKQDFEQTKNRANKPIVDYIHVDEDFRRQGIGTALYKAMAVHLGKLGMMLFASGCQTEKAEMAWENNKKIFPIVQVEEPYYNNTITRTAIDFTDGVSETFTETLVA